ncbi:MAG: UDP-N-acetylglucosamine 2-epimerase (hydrolyzing) [Deltaproteobacteria bacterium]|nr:UDP-N-acetylglucosamine 2-epimerase (hydrolyzing) [Deltaproteobacteria bacterium]
MKKKIVFLTGTRADFGKQKTLIQITNDSSLFDVHIWATGMHLNKKYDTTVEEIYKCGFNNKNIFKFINHLDHDSMDHILAKTIEGFSYYIKGIEPDLVIVHGDRVEALAGAIVGSLNNILVAHIEGGEISGTVDEQIRHAVSKMSHIHFVANAEAQLRLKQMGENDQSIFVIGSPDIDIMASNNLPSLETVKEYYEIPFKQYAVLIFHPVTTEYNEINAQTQSLVNAVIKSGDDFIVIYPNNDNGSGFIFDAYNKFKNNGHFRTYPSLRFEYFLTILKNAQYIIGNSSAGIREAPYYGVPTINIGTRQHNRTPSKKVINCDHNPENILASIKKAKTIKVPSETRFGTGNSARLFFDIICTESFWNMNQQKSFVDL